jgi:hypothetical protein
MVKLNCGFLETLQVVGINHHVQMHLFICNDAQHLVLKVCMQLASSSALLCFGIRQYAPHAITRIQFHAFNFHASCRSRNSRPWTQLHPELGKRRADG